MRRYPCSIRVDNPFNTALQIHTQNTFVHISKLEHDDSNESMFSTAHESVSTFTLENLMLASDWLNRVYSAQYTIHSSGWCTPHIWQSCHRLSGLQSILYQPLPLPKTYFHRLTSSVWEWQYRILMKVKVPGNTNQMASCGQCYIGWGGLFPKST